MNPFVFIILYCLFILIGSSSHAQDWANIERYKNDNIRIIQNHASGNPRIVFMGNSIFESWSKFRPDFFNNESYINRGISGQTTAQMLVRFRSDVIDLNPDIVVILAGTNDIAENLGPTTLEMIMDNIISMVELAKMNGVSVILCSVLPTDNYRWNPKIKPVEKIAALNILIKKYAEENKIHYVDYYSAMANDKSGLMKELTYDGVHPNEEGYKIMEPLTIETIEKILHFKNNLR